MNRNRKLARFNYFIRRVENNIERIDNKEVEYMDVDEKEVVEADEELYKEVRKEIFGGD